MECCISIVKLSISFLGLLIAIIVYFSIWPNIFWQTYSLWNKFLRDSLPWVQKLKMSCETYSSFLCFDSTCLPSVLTNNALDKFINLWDFVLLLMNIHVAASLVGYVICGHQNLCFLIMIFCLAHKEPILGGEEMAQLLRSLSACPKHWLNTDREMTNKST